MSRRRPLGCCCCCWGCCGAVVVRLRSADVGAGRRQSARHRWQRDGLTAGDRRSNHTKTETAQNWSRRSSKPRPRPEVVNYITAGQYSAPTRARRRVGRPTSDVSGTIIPRPRPKPHTSRPTLKTIIGRYLPSKTVLES